MKEKKTKARGAGVSPELVARAKAGDQDAFTGLYHATSAELYRSVRSMVRDEDLAWDILQDSYIRAWRGLDGLETNEAFLPWLRRIAVNVAATKLAERQPLTFTDLIWDGDEGEPDPPDPSPDVQPELALDRKETSRLVREILEELPEEQQLIVGMHYYEDMPVKEIAETLHIAPGTVKAQLFRGRKKVAAAVHDLEKQGVKLYGLPPLPFLIALLRGLEPAAGAEEKVLTALTGASGAGAAAVTAMTAGQAFLQGLGVKILAGGLTVALLAGGGKLLYNSLKNADEPQIGDVRPPVTEILGPAETEALSAAGTTAPTEPEEEALPVLGDAASINSKITGPAGTVFAQMYRGASPKDPVYGDVDGDGRVELVYHSGWYSSSSYGKAKFLRDLICVYGLEDGWPVCEASVLVANWDQDASLAVEDGTVYYRFRPNAAGAEPKQVSVTAANGRVILNGGEALPEKEFAVLCPGNLYGASFRYLKQEVGDAAIASCENALVWLEPGPLFRQEETAYGTRDIYALVTENGVTVTDVFTWSEKPEGGWEVTVASDAVIPRVSDPDSLLGLTEAELNLKIRTPHFREPAPDGSGTVLGWLTYDCQLLTVLVTDAVVSAELTDLKPTD